MPTREHHTKVRPLSGYEPQPGPTQTPTGIPAQPRPHGQLSLQQAVPESPPATVTFDHDKLAAVLRAVVEVYGGNRDLRQLRHALHPEVQRQLAGPLDTPARTYRLRTVHAHNTNDDVIEACGTVQHGDRALAMCARFDRIEHGWLCTQFTMMEPRGKRPCP